MAHFAFVTVWRLKTPLAPVWASVNDYEHWPAWWKGVEQVDIVRRGAADGVGTFAKEVWKSALPYRLRFDITVTKVIPMQVIEVSSDGALRGTGIMRFSTEGDETVVRFDWDVDTTEWWMNLIAPIAAPLFRWNHAVIMNWGAKCLAQHLNVELVQTQES